jgi:hypothetical protein
MQGNAHRGASQVQYQDKNLRYRGQIEARNLLARDPEEKNTMQAVLYIEPIVSPTEINVDLNVPDWVVHMLTSKGKPPPKLLVS